MYLYIKVVKLLLFQLSQASGAFYFIETDFEKNYMKIRSLFEQFSSLLASPGMHSQIQFCPEKKLMKFCSVLSVATFFSEIY